MIAMAGEMWGTYPLTNGEVHVVPHHDLRPHYMGTCACCPKQDEEDPNVWIHSSFDGREEFETGRRKMS